MKTVGARDHHSLPKSSSKRNSRYLSRYKQRRIKRLVPGGGIYYRHFQRLLENSINDGKVQ